MNTIDLSLDIRKAFQNDRIYRLMARTLTEDFNTFHVPDAQSLSNLTMETLKKSGTDYATAAKHLALSVYADWHGTNVKNLYHEYNWRVERTGSAKVAEPFIQGNSLLDIGGGPGTFALETIALKQQRECPLKVTVADIKDYRNSTAIANGNIEYKRLAIGERFPFPDKAFDSGSLLYVLHHVTSDHDAFLRECGRCIRKSLVIFEDVRVDTTKGTPRGQYQAPRKLEADFTALSLDEQTLFIAGIDYVCNHIASQALSMPIPGRYYEFQELYEKLINLFPDSKVSKHYHGIYTTKCYPNPEAMYVVEFD